MKAEAIIFNLITAAMFAFAASYAIWRKLAEGRVDWRGVTPIGLGGMLCGMAGPCF
jgi:uncharacterized membrane protein YfcA